MNLKAITIAAAALAVSSTTVSAQSIRNSNNNCGPQTCAVGQLCDSACVRPGAPCINPFEGLNLTADQQAKLQQACPATQRPGREERRQARTNERKEYLAKVKTILTPEQYTQFLENNFVNAGHNHHRGGKARNGNFHRNGCNAQRPCAAQPQK